MSISCYKTIKCCDIGSAYCFLQYRNSLHCSPWQLVTTCNDTHCDIRYFCLHVQWEGRTALVWASQGGYLDVVKELLRAQAGVDMRDEVCRLC